jgi:hypothetical protein
VHICAVVERSLGFLGVCCCKKNPSSTPRQSTSLRAAESHVSYNAAVYEWGRGSGIFSICVRKVFFLNRMHVGWSYPLGRIFLTSNIWKIQCRISCASVYPIHNDFYKWSARSNKSFQTDAYHLQLFTYTFLWNKRGQKMYLQKTWKPKRKNTTETETKNNLLLDDILPLPWV